MDIKQAYDRWASQYDTNQNKTRDLEATSLRETLNDIHVDTCLEIGCGTGKNTIWLAKHARSLTSVDFSGEMLRKAREKITSNSIQFVEADITHPWTFAVHRFDLITFSLVLEHIEDLHAIFKKAAGVLRPGGWVYVGELHPFKQYTGSKAKFETTDGVSVVTCFTHHISEFIQAAFTNGFELYHFHEYFDDNNRSSVPRIMTLLLRKK